MLIGILSDTHGREPAMAAAMRILRSREAEFFFHCGDIGGEAVLDHLAGTRALAVWGNTDDSAGRLASYARHVGVVIHDRFGEIELDGKLFGVTHGDDGRIVQRVIAEQRHDYLLLGHTHQRSDSRHGHVRIINPGALHRAAEKTVALLDSSTDRLEFIPIRL